MKSKMPAWAKSRVLQNRFLMRPFFKLLKKDSATALSQQLPRRQHTVLQVIGFQEALPVIAAILGAMIRLDSLKMREL
jgi:hypothetical protein